MMNVEDDDVNLGVGMGSSKFCIRTKSLRTSGAGVNAVNLAFATSDPLSELVWSPHHGLTLKCATSAAADTKPFLLWNVGQDLSPVDHMIIDKAASDSRLRDCDGWKMEEVDEKDAVREGNRVADLEVNPQNVKMDDIGDEIADALLKKLESSAENELRRLTEKDDLTLGGAELPEENALLCQENGKGKALSDGRSSGEDDEDDSHESVESCNGAGRGMKGVKRQICDKGVILGSKKMKMQIHGSTSVTRPDSSFMNWISNVTKGVSDSPSPLALACFNDKFICFRQQDSASLSMGFQSIFQSLCCKEADAMNNGGKKIAEPMEEAKEDDRNGGNSCEQCNKEDDPTHSHALDEEMKITAKEAYPDIPRDVAVQGNPRTSLWISRFSTNTPRPEKGKEIAEENMGCSSSCRKADLDGQMNVVFPNSSETRGGSADSKFNAGSRNFIIKSVKSVLPSQRFSTEAMASVFARRLDALRQHIICFFCGGFHDVHECPNVTKHELEDLVLKFDGAEESLCLCIRCSQSDHWAVSCPSSRQKASDCSRKPVLEYQALKLEISTSKGRPDVASLHKSQIFDAIRKLRLSRAEILRWMNSNVSLSRLNGFFLRLRLDAGLGSSSYYLACIAGENEYCKSSKSILVDVGGVKSYVATQHVSNHEFLEDEIEAWWCSGCTLPSLADLNSKLNHRNTLGMKTDHATKLKRLLNFNFSKQS